MAFRDRDAMLDACAATFLARMRRRLAENEARSRLLRERAAAAARLLCDRHGARRVWLYGSLAWGTTHERSDVDLLVEGLDAAGWSAASRSVEDLVDAPVDLVRTEDAPPALVERVHREGCLLHDAG